MRCAALALVATLAVVVPAAAEALTEVHYVMGTYFRITADAVDGEPTRAALRRCFATTRELDARFSRFDDHSELSRLNASLDDTVIVSPEMTALLGAALALRVATGGIFDVGAGALTSLWRTASEWPSDETIAARRRTAGDGAFALGGGSLSRRAGTTLDLDGIAKGWAVDRCVAELRADALHRVFLSFGESSLYALGKPQGHRGWRLLLRGLDDETALGALALRDEAVSVSAVFGHERLVGGRRVGHIVDPRSGLPLTSPAMAVVVAPTATAAEAFSKALLIDPHGAAAALRSGVISGALVIRPSGVERLGHIDFTPFARAQTIRATAEPLR